MEFWHKWLSGTDLGASLVSQYAPFFVHNELTQDDIPMLNHDLLSSIGVKVAKHRIFILKHKNKLATKPVPASRTGCAGLQSDIVVHLKQGQLDDSKLLKWTKGGWALCTRDAVVQKGYLLQEAPKQGLSIIPAAYRTETGKNLLFDAKAMLWAALFGDSDTHVTLARVERELLSLTVPVKKAHVFNFFESVTEIGASGTWRDPDNVSNDEDAPNMVLQVEYGDVASEVIGDTIMVCILLINLLEVNEEILYARSGNVEQSTLKIQLFFEK